MSKNNSRTTTSHNPNLKDIEKNKTISNNNNRERLPSST